MDVDRSNQELRDATFRRGEFRETAREIVRRDRELKKFGRQVDTGGAIARAMEAAYKLGLAHGNSSPPVTVQDSRPSDVIAWNSIPPRSRSIFERIVSLKWAVLNGVDGSSWPAVKDVWVCYWDRGESQPDGQRYEVADTYRRSTLVPVVRLGLMEEHEIRGRMTLEVTPLGLATWEHAVATGLVGGPRM